MMLIELGIVILIFAKHALERFILIRKKLLWKIFLEHQKQEKDG